MEIRALREDDDRARFRSGDDALDRFLHRFAGQNQFRHFIGVTYVAIEGKRILGYATVAPGHLEIDGLPAPDRRSLPTYPLPILRLARLAVEEHGRGSGVGGALLQYVLNLAARMADEFGGVGVIVDAKDAATTFYAKYGFVPVEAVEGRSDARPEPTAMFLSITAIRKATSG